MPCIVLNLSEEQAQAYRVLDNKLGEVAEWDTFLLEGEIKELVDKGFEIEEWDIKFEEEQTEELEIIEPDTQQKIEKYKQLTVQNTKKIKHLRKVKRFFLLTIQLQTPATNILLSKICERTMTGFRC